MLEVCVDSLESAINAIHGSANELEVCSSLTEGGLTPTFGLMKQILQMTKNLSLGIPIHKTCTNMCCGKPIQVPKVNVMIRCRSGSDFCYSETEMETMLTDLETIKLMGVDRFVFGALTDQQEVDEINCKRIIAKAHPIPVTFHRAFDVCKDPIAAIDKIISIGFSRLLTSGQRPCAPDYAAMKLIKTLLDSYGKAIDIMPGAGVNADNAKSFMDMGCKIIHSSCKKVKNTPRIENNLCLGTNDSECVYVTDENIVKKTKQAISCEKKDNYLLRMLLK